MTLLKAVLSSSGTDVPAEDWVLVGTDIAVADGQSTLSIVSSDTNFCGFRFIADLEGDGNQTLSFNFAGNANSVYRQTKFVEGTATLTLGNIDPIQRNYDAGRIFLMGTVYFADNVGGRSKFSVVSQRVVSATDCELDTFDGYLYSNLTTPTMRIDGTHGKNSRLTVYGIPKDVVS